VNERNVQAGFTEETFEPPARRKSRAGISRRSNEGRLTRKDWILAGQDMLRAEGIAGLKLASLTGRLGVSTGSFYHHFADFEDYLGAVAEYFSADRVQG